MTTLLSHEEKIFLIMNVKCCSINRKGNHNLNELRENFKDKFHKNAPSVRGIQNLIKKFEATGSVSNLKKNSGLQRSVRVSENMEQIKEIFSTSFISIRKAALQTKFSRSSIHRILHEIPYHPYKIEVFFKLKSIDYEARVSFCNRVLTLIDQDHTFIENLWMSDEAHFHTEGYVNKQNLRMWGSQPPTTFIEKPLHSNYVTVWAAISVKGIIGPFFFEDATGKRTTVTSSRYIELLQNKFYPSISLFPGVDLTLTWFQHDGATSHTTNVVRQWLSNHFPNRHISRLTNFPYPPRSPDLSVPDFFLWGALKDAVYFERRPLTVDELKNKITQEFAKIKIEQCRSSFSSLQKRLRDCVRQEGRHLRNVFHHQTGPH